MMRVGQQRMQAIMRNSKSSYWPVTKKSVRHKKWSPGPILAAKTGPPLPILVLHENVILQPSKVAS